MPRTHGMTELHIDSFDFIVNVDEPLPEGLEFPPSLVETQIGKTISELVSDGATLQMGIGKLRIYFIDTYLNIHVGSIPDAVLRELTLHKDLGIHTEMLAEEAIKLIQKGIITNRHKKFLPGKTLTSFALVNSMSNMDILIFSRTRVLEMSMISSTTMSRFPSWILALQTILISLRVIPTVFFYFL